MSTAAMYVNLGVRFLLELCALAALGYWGFHTGQGWLPRVILTIGAPLLAAVVWGMFVAPKATVPVSDMTRLALEIAVFGAAGAGLYVAGQPTAAGILVALYIINRVLMVVWGQ
ncbi:MAG TPA: YrdB family protein [Roseiflexaceae bacterium]|nr:YrdB family protein [Roseiflexaceae bacterium]